MPSNAIQRLNIHIYSHKNGNFQNVKDEPENAGSEDYSVIMYAGIAVAALFVVVGAIAFIRHRKKDDGEYTKGDKA